MVLVTWVEDEPNVQELLRKLFEHWHVPAQGAGDAETAWHLFRQNPTPMVLVDILLPGRDGFWFIEQVRQEWPETIGLVITGSADKETLLRCMRSGVLRCFTKPLDMDDLQKAILQQVERIRHERERIRHIHDLHLRLRQNARRQAEKIVQASECLLKALSLHDPVGAAHCRRVARYARVFGRFLRLNAPHLLALDLAARFHDVGKLGLPSHLLYHPGPLGESDWALVRQHPLRSEQICQPLVKHPLVLQAIRHHHERWDGQGYPDGLAKEQIPWLARILTIVDAYDAMTSVRPYRTPKNNIEACAELERHAGQQFDPELSRIFIRLVQRQPEWFAPEMPPQSAQSAMMVASKPTSTPHQKSQLAAAVRTPEQR